jgi:hypothetical protein
MWRTDSPSESSIFPLKLLILITKNFKRNIICIAFCIASNGKSIFGVTDLLENRHPTMFPT